MPIILGITVEAEISDRWPAAMILGAEQASDSENKNAPVDASTALRMFTGIAAMAEHGFSEDQFCQYCNICFAILTQVGDWMQKGKDSPVILKANDNDSPDTSGPKKLLTANLHYMVLDTLTDEEGKK